MAPMSASNAFARIICRARPVSFDSPRESIRYSFMPSFVAASAMETVLTSAARYAVSSPSAFSGYFAYKNSVTASSKTASPKNSKRSLCSRPSERVLFRSELWVNACSTRRLFWNSYPIFVSKSAKFIPDLLFPPPCKCIYRRYDYFQRIVIKIEVADRRKREPLRVVEHARRPEFELGEGRLREKIRDAFAFLSAFDLRVVGDVFVDAELLDYLNVESEFLFYFARRSTLHVLSFLYLSF